MEFLTTVFYFLVTIGVLVFIHELGHFIAAKAGCASTDSR
jgi:membrane-associated protease RseP (regulator of RpoE activity)